MLSELVKQVLRKARRVQKNYASYVRNMKHLYLQRTMEMSDILDDRSLQLKALELKLGAYDLQRRRENENIYNTTTNTNIIINNNIKHNININNNNNEDDLNMAIVIKPKISDNIEDLINESMFEEEMDIDDINQDPNDIRNAIIVKYKAMSKKLAEQIGIERKSSLNSLTVMKKQLLLYQSEIEKLKKEILNKEKINKDQSDQLNVYSLKYKH